MTQRWETELGTSPASSFLLKLISVTSVGLFFFSADWLSLFHLFRSKNDQFNWA